MIYAASQYFATGEGNTTCLLVTKAYPLSEDYKIPPSFVDGYTPGVLNKSEEDIALREFEEHFGSWYASGIEFFTEEEFLSRFSRHLPSFLADVIKKGAGNINYKMQLHLNFS